MTSLGRYLGRDVEREVSATQSVYKLEGLQPGTEYVCTLRASTSKGYGPAIRKVFYTTPQCE